MIELIVPVRKAPDEAVNTERQLNFETRIVRKLVPSLKNQLFLSSKMIRQGGRLQIIKISYYIIIFVISMVALVAVLVVFKEMVVVVTTQEEMEVPVVVVPVVVVVVHFQQIQTARDN